MHAAFSEESMVNVLALWVEVIEHHVGITAVGSSEDDDFEILAQFLKSLNGIRSNVDSSLIGALGH